MLSLQGPDLTGSSRLEQMGDRGELDVLAELKAELERMEVSRAASLLGISSLTTVIVSPAIGTGPAFAVWLKPKLRSSAHYTFDFVVIDCRPPLVTWCARR
ncbi:MAG: hypothetical protein AB1640_18940 [bacterium]